MLCSERWQRRQYEIDSERDAKIKINLKIMISLQSKIGDKDQQ